MISEEEFTDAREIIKDYEAFCDKISRMDDEQLKEFAMTLSKN